MACMERSDDRKSDICVRRLNVTMPATSLSHVLCYHQFVMIGVKKYFLHKWHHVLCIITSSIIPSSSILITRWRDLWQPCINLLTCDWLFKLAKILTKDMKKSTLCNNKGTTHNNWLYIVIQSFVDIGLKMFMIVYWT